MTKKFRVFTIVNSHYDITIDEEKFTPEVMEGFNKYIQYVGDRPKDHAEEIARLLATNVYSDSHEFFEGYGLLKDIGVKVIHDERETFVELDTREI